MADYRSDWLSFEAALDAALLTASLPGLHQHVVRDPNAPSAVRVLGKSMYMLAAGWVASVAWLWIAGIQQHLLRHGTAPEGYSLSTALNGLIPAALIAVAGIAIDRWAGHAPNKWLQRREWIHGFWWAFVPNALLLFTVWVMIQEAR
jgi:hypothetical protein